MKTFCLTTMIVAFLFFCTNGIQAQISQTKLNQIELGKQFLGTWKAEVAKDTFNIWEQKLFGTGMEATIKIVTKGKIITEGKAIMGYDKKTINLLKPTFLKVQTLWFMHFGSHRRIHAYKFHMSISPILNKHLQKRHLNSNPLICL